jgi:peptidyl-prolyl cis-trans isomerase D
MLKSLRMNARYFYVLFGLVILSFVLWVPGMQNDGPESEPLAIVGDEEISLDEFWRGYDRAQELYQDVYKEKYDEKMQERLKQDVLSSLVESRIFEMAARDSGITVSDEELNDAITHDPVFMREGAFNVQVYRNALRLNRLTPALYESSKRNELILRKMRNIYELAVDLGPAELEQVPEDNELRGALEEALIDQKQQGAILSFANAYRQRLKVKVNEHLIL